MHFYLLTPKTKPVSFLRLLQGGRDPQAIQPLSEATAYRERMRETLKDYRLDAQRQDVARVVSSIEAYLPHLFWCVDYQESSGQPNSVSPLRASANRIQNPDNNDDSDEEGPSSSAAGPRGDSGNGGGGNGQVRATLRARSTEAGSSFEWKSPVLTGLEDTTRLGLMKNKLRRVRFISSSIYFEAAFTLLAYGIALSTLGFQLIDGLTISGGEGGLSEAETKKHKQAIAYLCQAAGVYHYVCDQIASKWRPASGDWAPDLAPEMLTMLSKLALADAQRIAIRITIPQKKSSSLVAKLLLGVVEEYDLALRLLQAQSAGEVTEMTADLQLYIRNSHLYLTACAKCYLAKDHHQHDRNGLAVGFAQLAARDLETLAKNPKSAYAQEACRVLAEIRADCALYDKLNSTVTFAPVPKAEELVRQIPGGRSLLKMEVFTPSVLKQRTAGDAHSAAATAEKTYALQHEYY